MAGIDVNKITSTLARLPDQALQQYAQMHKNDPYIMSLAVSESNRRKEMRAAAQAPQGMQEQPKVADAALAQMAPPQEQGLAALPAPNMQMMADGGIAGYEGYDEGDSAYGQEPVMMMAGGGQVEHYQVGGSTMDGFTPSFEELELADQAAYLRQQDKLMKGRASRRTGDEFDAEEAMLFNRTAAPAPEIPRAKSSGKGKGADKSKANIITPPKQEAAPTTAATPSGGIADLFKASTAAELGAEAEALSKKDIERMNKEYSPFLEELKAEKEALSKRKDSNVGEALLRAGLSIAGGTSRNAIQNIAAGATAGLDAYTAAQKADEAARRALRQSEMSIMQAQRAERSGYHKDAIALTNQSRQERQFAVSAHNQAEQIKNTKAYQEGSLANQRIMAEAARTRANAMGGGANALTKEAQVKLNQLKALSTNLKDELKDPFLNLPRNAAQKKAVEAQLAQVNAALAQAAGLGTMMPASPTGARGGVKFLGYED